ncbi:MAG: protein kinase, partial [Candidatus Krumholzibacteria bacterium]|nr:protein kinase [Candidatus Krumholzibacteria bacterium]
MIGETISHYKILEKLGEGGMGVIYKAEDTRLKRTVALKFLPPFMTRDPQAKERFIQEAQAASALDHSNICNIHEIGEMEDGQMFIVMAYYEGETLKKKIEGGPLKISEAIDITIQVTEGLARAHESGITHRDIKPANIIITNRGEVKIVDFGLAKLAGQTKLTTTGTTVGTVAYMSPEQARGAEIDQRTDIWSLGVVLYEMLTGQAPFKGEYEQAVIYSILNEEARPVSSLRSNVYTELQEIIERALLKDLSQRYQTVGTVLADLQRIKEATTVSGSRTARSRGYKRLITSKRKISLFVAVVILLIAGYLLLTKVFIREGSGDLFASRKKIVVLPFENLGLPEDKYFTDGITEEITSRLAAVSGLGVISRHSALQYDKEG